MRAPATLTEIANAPSQIDINDLLDVEPQAVSLINGLCCSFHCLLAKRAMQPSDCGWHSRAANRQTDRHYANTRVGDEFGGARRAIIGWADAPDPEPGQRERCGWG